MTEVQEKFINLLKEMFQFDQADLDFGIYRIMNAKHGEIEKFLNEDLPNDINEGLSSLKNPTSAEKIKKLEDDLTKAKEWNIKEKITEIENELASLKTSVATSAAENEIYNNLLDFFSRYYDEGDFISQRRYSKGKYAIPYEGEEVKLHWANADQYYIKTGEYFKDYTFSDGTNKVHFKLLDAQTELNNNKSKDKKFFQLTEQEKKFEIINDELFIYIEYKSGIQKNQKAYNSEIVEIFTRYTDENINEYRKFREILKKEKKQDISILEKQLNRYTARNTFDYFIHKDLSGFLTQELDFFIKNEVIRLDDIDETDEAKTKLILTKAKVLRTIAKKIIAFLAQLEDFQKKLFLKKKFVTETNYCITLDRIDESFYAEIAANDEQRKEWIKLFAIDEIKTTGDDIFSSGKTAYSEPLTVEFLKENPYLVLDTAFFNEEFKEKLIASIDNLDEKLDGLLISSDNFQALNLVNTNCQNNISCIYIDPPYNTGGDGFIYKDNYKHSNWLSMMYDRLMFARNVLTGEGVIFISIDDNEQANLKILCDLVLGKENFVAQFPWRKRTAKSDVPFGVSQDYEWILCYSKTNMFIASVEGKERKYYVSDDYPNKPWRIHDLTKQTTASERPNSYFTIINPKNGDKYPCNPNATWRITKETFDDYYRAGRLVFPGDYDFLKITKPVLRYWKEDDEKKAGDRFGQIAVSTKLPENIGMSQDGTKEITSLLGEKAFAYPKSMELLKFLYKISMSKSKNALAKSSYIDDVYSPFVLDFFAGSGTTAHAVINLNREDGGNRKYILCEMGEYFDTVTKPRVQKVIYSKDWKDGKPVSREGSSHAFKYIRLESYEDTLNNISLKSVSGDFFESARKDYFLNYMMDFEAKESDCLLNLDKFAHPFDYTMKITRKQECKEQKIDLVETFNYLIGLNVTSNGALQSYDAIFSTDSSKPLTATLKNNGSTYRIKMIEGTNRAGERVLVIWRDLTGDIEKDNAVLDAFFAKKHVNPLDFEYKTIYVNGDNNLQNVKTEDENWKVILIESEMKKRMFEV